jgi:hypothetical protein
LILPLEEDPNSQSVKSTNLNMNGNILEYIEQHQAVIGVITVIIITVILLVVLIILTIPIMRTCIHCPSTSNDLEVQDTGSPYLIQPTDHEPLPYLLPEPDFFTSEAYPKQNNHRVEIINKNKSHLRDFIRSPVNKCIKTPNQQGILKGRRQIVPEHENNAVTTCSNNWNFGERGTDYEDAFYQ